MPYSIINNINIIFTRRTRSPYLPYYNIAYNYNML